jgi:hypothetical protein
MLTAPSSSPSVLRSPPSAPSPLSPSPLSLSLSLSLSLLCSGLNQIQNTLTGVYAASDLVVDVVRLSRLASLMSMANQGYPMAALSPLANPELVNINWLNTTDPVNTAARGVFLKHLADTLFRVVPTIVTDIEKLRSTALATGRADLVDSMNEPSVAVWRYVANPASPGTFLGTKVYESVYVAGLEMCDILMSVAQIPDARTVQPRDPVAGPLLSWLAANAAYGTAIHDALNETSLQWFSDFQGMSAQVDSNVLIMMSSLL